MNRWISHPTTLKGEIVELLPLEEDHFGELVALAKDKRIWQHYIMDGSNAIIMVGALQEALTERAKEAQYPFTIWHKGEGKIIGSTRFLYLQPKHRKLEIGWTWIHPDYWATPVNLECKWLLLTHCFEKLHTGRVQLKTDAHNLRSRKAIEKIGAQFEGILRNDMIREDHTKRNSAYYSIIEEEWEEKKSRLTALLHDQRKV